MPEQICGIGESSWFYYKVNLPIYPPNIPLIWSRTEDHH